MSIYYLVSSGEILLALEEKEDNNFHHLQVIEREVHNPWPSADEASESR